MSPRDPLSASAVLDGITSKAYHRVWIKNIYIEILEVRFGSLNNKHFTN